MPSWCHLYCTVLYVLQYCDLYCTMCTAILWFVLCIITHMSALKLEQLYLTWCGGDMVSLKLLILLFWAYPPDCSYQHISFFSDLITFPFYSVHTKCWKNHMTVNWSSLRNWLIVRAITVNWNGMETGVGVLSRWVRNDMCTEILWFVLVYVCTALLSHRPI